MRRPTLLALAMALAPAPALAQSPGTVLYENDFDTENGGQTALNYDAVTGFSSGFPGSSVDLVHTGDGNGITCAGGAGGCLDLDGTTNSAGLLFSDANYDFRPGEIYTLSYSISGSQRAGFGTDGYALGFGFYDPASFYYSFDTSSGGHAAGYFDGVFQLNAGNDGVAFDRPFTDVRLTFRPTTSGTFYLGIDGFSLGANDSNNDNVGLVLDNLRLSVAAVPEPATWALMILGFGATGGAMRRRRRGALGFA